MTQISAVNYIHSHAALQTHHDYLLPGLVSALGNLTNRRIFEIGFGNGSVAHYLTGLGYEVAGIEPSASGLSHARLSYPTLELHQGDAYQPLAERFGQFAAVYSLEVIEHVYSPRQFMQTAYALVQPGGILILSTPYHGYLKNLAIAAAGGFDRHVNPLWDHGHIKFWSIRTLTVLLSESGFVNPSFVRVGRIPQLAKSMIAIAHRPK